MDDPRYKIFDSVFKTKGTTYQTEHPSETKLLAGSSEEKMKKKKALLEEGNVETYRNQLLKYMTDEAPYLNPDLSLRSLAGLINMQPNQLSWLLNESLGKNFNEFINHYRVETFKNLAKESRQCQYYGFRIGLR